MLSESLSNLRAASWRRDAAQIVEELFPRVPTSDWDLLIDLRQGLILGTDWVSTLDQFLMARERLEADHYLPFYRLRRLIAASLRLEGVGGRCGESLQTIEGLLRSRLRSFSDLKRKWEREVFEHLLESEGRMDLRVVEQI